jgi:hypothetical protein
VGAAAAGGAETEDGAPDEYELDWCVGSDEVDALLREEARHRE